MRHLVLAWLLIVCTLPLASSQDSESKQEGGPPSAEQQEPSPKPAPKRPSLGPAPPPTLMGPRTSTTNDPRKLLRVKKVYVERMENNLHEKLIEALTKIHRFSLVGDYSEADAVLRGTCMDMKRLKTLKTDVFLNEVNGASLWQDIVRRPINPPTVEVAATETSEIIATHLADSMVEAERH